MDKDLFGNDIKLASDSTEEELKNYDIQSFEGRLKRLKSINKIFPFGQREYGSDESYLIFDEAVHSYIFGQYIATIILAQAFIERRFQEYFHIRFDNKRAKYTLDKFIKEFKETEFLPDFILDKIDKIRLKRNPFVHHRMPLQKDTLMARAYSSETHPDELLHNDAKDALEIMFHMVQRRIL
jgi:hypothetical protein